jgi:hypothetical protein
MKEIRVGLSCDNCGQAIVLYVPEESEEMFGSLFQEVTFWRLSSLDICDPSRYIAEYWYCSDYCARDHLEDRIHAREEQNRRAHHANQLAFNFRSAA